MFYKNLILLLALITIASCGPTGIRFNPEFFISDYENEQLINEQGFTVRCNSPEFNSYVCMHKQKVIELLEILRRQNNLPKEERLKVQELERSITK